MSPLASRVAIIAAGGFFLVGLMCGAWKYRAIARSADARAPTYVDIAHRSALLYAFACVLIERFVALSRLDDMVETAAVIAQVSFFALAVLSYIAHGLLRDTDNQLARPHRLGGSTISAMAMSAFMHTLIAAEIGGFAVLFWGALA